MVHCTLYASDGSSHELVSWPQGCICLKLTYIHQVVLLVLYGNQHTTVHTICFALSITFGCTLTNNSNN